MAREAIEDFATFACKKVSLLADGRYAMTKIALWGKLALLVPALSWGVNVFSSDGLARDALLDGLPALRSESLGSDGYGNTVLWRISSAVELVERDDSGSRALPHFVSLADPKGESTSGLYRYRYVFENDGTSTIRINHSEWDVVQSPLTEILQDLCWNLMRRRAQWWSSSRTKASPLKT